MKPSSSVRPSVTVIEHEGPARGCSSTWDEFLAARSLFKELSAEALWNPWIRDDRATDMEHAMSVMGQWTRAEPNFRPLSAKQLDTQLARLDRKFEAEHAQTVLRQERDGERYDAGREAARLSLLEQRSRLGHELAELAGLENGTRFPAMAAATRASDRRSPRRRRRTTNRPPTWCSMRSIKQSLHVTERVSRICRDQFTIMMRALNLDFRSHDAACCGLNW
jgi:hypothetical protein